MPPTRALDDIDYLVGSDVEEVKFDAFTQIPACNYVLKYTILVNQNDIANDLKMTVSHETDLKVEIETDDTFYTGVQTVYIVAETENQSPAISNLEHYSFEVEILSSDDTEVNTPPAFSEILPELRVNQEDNFEFPLPEIVDDNDDGVTITVSLAGASDFLEFVEGTKTIKLSNGSLLQPGNYSITITLEDDNPQGSLSSTS